VKTSSVDPLKLASEEDPFLDYEKVKEVLNKGEKSRFFAEYKPEIKFLLRHCYHRSYYLHFKKCYRV